jgi:hypothetical protein
MSKKKKTKKLVLALGESSHTHILNCAKEIEYEQGTDEAISFLLKDTGVVTHEEHDRIVLPPGKFHKTNQVEWNPFSQETSRVFD